MEATQIILSDIFGREVKKIDLFPGMTTDLMDLSNIPEGMYMARLISSDKVNWSEKIMVKR
jgi:hypothetical protein